MAQSFKTRDLDEQEIASVFFGGRTPEEKKAIFDSIRTKTYNVVIEYRGKPLFVDALAKNGGLFINMGKNIRFCARESDFTEKDLRHFYNRAYVRMRQDFHNEEFICSNNFNVVEKDEDDGKPKIVHVLYPILTTRIVEVSINENQNPTNSKELLNKAKMSKKEVQNDSGSLKASSGIIESPSTEAPQWPLK